MYQEYWKRATFLMSAVNAAIFLVYLILSLRSVGPDALRAVLIIAIFFNGSCLLWSMWRKGESFPEEEE